LSKKLDLTIHICTKVDMIGKVYPLNTQLEIQFLVSI